MNYHKGLNITDEEKELIEEVKKNVEENNRKKKKNEKKEKVWDHANLTELKSRIKQHYRNNMGELCCYCRKNFHGEFNMVIDIEHILPKKHFEMFEFTDFISQ